MIHNLVRTHLIHSVPNKKSPGGPRRPINQLGDPKTHLDGPLSDQRSLPSKDISYQQKWILSNAHSTLPQQTTQQWPGDPTFLHWWSVGWPIIFVYCPASRTTLVATRFRVAAICPIIQVPHCIRVFFYFVWFVFINHIFHFYYELCTYCNILDIYLS